MSDQTQRETELRIQLAEARTDKKFADMLGEMRTGFAQLDGRFGRLEARLDTLERSTSGLKATVITTGIGTGIGVVAVVVATLAYGGSLFGNGLTTRDAINNAVTQELQHQAPGMGKRP